jgi:hypothetical protein
MKLMGDACTLGGEIETKVNVSSIVSTGDCACVHGEMSILM